MMMMIKLKNLYFDEKRNFIKKKKTTDKNLRYRRVGCYLPLCTHKGLINGLLNLRDAHARQQ